MKTDTIAAVATAFSESGIGIIRISGEDAFTITDRIFIGKRDFERFCQTENKANFQKKYFLKDAKTYTLHYGYIIDGETVLDEALVSIMRAPKSYTAEDVAEINCHGGILILQNIMELVIKNGARTAEPGEFTKRAFLNGRIDLSEAEAVMDLIKSENEFALQSSIGQLKGSVSSIIKGLRAKIIYEIAFIESALDDPENYNTDGYGEKLSKILENIEKRIEGLIVHADSGRILKEGIKTVILGKPNVGKSSFLNELSGEEWAIVTDIAGTTRDILEENIRFGGISLRVIDTAGIRKTEDTIEKIGVEKAKKYASQADLIVYIIDSSVGLNESDEEILEILKDKRFIVLLNKSDLDMVVTEEEIADRLKDFTAHEVIKTSVLKHQGIEEFEKAVKKMFFDGELSLRQDAIITSVRHKEALLEAKESIHMVRESIDAGMSEDFYFVDMMNAYAALGRIIGEEVGDDLINEIFEKFCIGK